MSISRSELGSNDVFDFAFNRIIKNCENEVPGNLITTIVVPADGETVYGARFAGNERAVVLLSPAADAAVVGPLTNILGATALPDVLKKIRKLQAVNPADSYIIPLAECNNLLGVFSRRHWTMLLIQNNECYFFDPKSAVMWPPSEISGSSLYSVAHIQKFLLDEKFNLQNCDLTYLGWQEPSDQVNCGRYCAELAGKLTLKILNGAENAESLKSNLQIVPPLDDLIKLSGESTAHKIILGVSRIVEARSQLYLSSKLRPADLGQYSSTKKDAKQNHALQIRKGLDFFEKGAGGLKQFHRDGPALKFTVQGKTYAELFPNGEDTSVNEAAKNSGLTLEQFQNIIAAHSQGPAAFIPFVMGFGILKEEETGKISIVQPDAVNMQITHNGESAELTCEIKEMKILCMETRRNVGTIEGPINVAFTMAQKDGAWGWQLRYLISDNVDVLRIMQGIMLPESYIVDHFCKFSNATVVDSAQVINDAYVDDKLVTPLTELVANMAKLKQEKTLLEQDVKRLNAALVALPKSDARKLLKDKDVEIKALKTQSDKDQASVERAEQSLIKSALIEKEFKAMQVRYGNYEGEIKGLQAQLANTIIQKTETQAQHEIAKNELKTQLQEAFDSMQTMRDSLKLAEACVQALSDDKERLTAELEQSKLDLAEQQKLTNQLAADSEAKETQLVGENAGLKNINSVQDEIESELAAELADVKKELTDSFAREVLLQEKLALANGSERDAALKLAEEKLTDMFNHAQETHTQDRIELKSRLAKLQLASDEAVKQLEQRITIAEEKHLEECTSFETQLDALTTQNERLRTDLAAAQAMHASTETNLHVVAPYRAPKAPVLAYAAGGVVAGGLGLTAAMIATGVISLSLLAAIPVVGWGIAAGALLAFTIVLTVKSIMNAFANSRAAQVRMIIADHVKDKLDTIISQPDVRINISAENLKLSKVDFSMQKSALQVNSFLNSQSATCTQVLEAQVENGPDNSFRA